jgi:hypothetical protein
MCYTACTARSTTTEISATECACARERCFTEPCDKRSLRSLFSDLPGCAGRFLLSFRFEATRPECRVGFHL